MDRYLIHLRDNLMSLIFTIVSSEIVLYSAHRTFNFIYALIVAIIVIFLYCMFLEVVQLDKRGPLLYGGVAAVFFIIIFVCLSLGGILAQVSFYRWFMGGGNLIEKNLLYQIASTLLIPFTLTSLIYYFTVTITRKVMILLISFIVLTLNIKSVYKINSPWIIGFIIIFFIVFISSENNSGVVKKRKQINILAATVPFILVLFTIGFLLPKPNRLPKIAGLEGLKTFVNGYINNADSTSGTINNGSDRDIDSPMNLNSNKVLYSFTGDNPKYLIDKNYDYYKDNKWVQQDKNKQKEYNFKDINIYPKVYDTFIVLYNNKSLTVEDINKYYSGKDKKSSIEIKVEALTTNILTHPKNTTTVDSSISEGSFFLNDSDEIYRRRKEIFDRTDSYYMEYFNEDKISNIKTEEILTTYTLDKYLALFNNDVSDDSIKEEAIDTVNEYTKVEKTLPRLKDLANNITSGSDSYYEKAKKIEEYLAKGEYKYNLDLPKQTGKGDYIEYFLFEGKEGYCIQFATAMTLLCREAGVPARYVEGFLVEEEDYFNGRYEVKESNGHAFVEVYIPGYGWKIFDPTPSGPRQEMKKTESKNPENNIANKIDFKKIVTIVLTSIASILLITITTILSIVIYKKTKRPRYLKRVKRMKREEAFEELIRNSIEQLKDDGLTILKGESEITFAERVDRKTNVGLKVVMELYYLTKYGDKQVEDIYIEKALELNEKIYEYMKR